MASRSKLNRVLGVVLPLTLAGLGLAAADEPGTPAVPEKPAAAPAMQDGSAVAKVIEATYACESGATVDVRYNNTNADAPMATLQYKGRSFEMHNVRSGSGARYATEQGLSPDHGLQWWIKGDEATLSEMVMDHTAPEPKPIETCRARQGAG